MLKKILLSMIIIIVMIIVMGIITMIVFITGTKKAYPSNEIITKSKNSIGKEALVIYQNCRSEFPKEIANSIATGLNNKGYTVTVNTAGDFLPTDVSKYDLVIFGGAVIAGNVGEPLQKYAKNIEKFGDAKVILYSTGSGVDNIVELDNLEKLLGKMPVQKVKFAYSDKEGSKTKAVLLGEEFGND